MLYYWATPDPAPSNPQGADRPDRLLAGDVVADLLTSGAWDVVHERDDGGFLVRDESGQRLAVWPIDGTEGVDPASRSPGWSTPT